MTANILKQVPNTYKIKIALKERLLIFGVSLFSKQHLINT